MNGNLPEERGSTIDRRYYTERSAPFASEPPRAPAEFRRGVEAPAE
jgi:hypothetical protein